MGNLLSLFKSKQNSHGVSRSISGGTAGSNHGVTGRTPSYDPGMSRKLNINDTSASKARSGTEKHKYAYIPDNYTSLQQVTDALRKEGLESSNLIVGIDFTKSNEWTGKVSFRNRSLHAIGDEPNPYEKAISIIGKTLAPFDEDNLIPCFGFGDATTHDQEVFSFHNDHSPCHGFEEVLACYKRIVPNLRLWVEAAMDIVEKSGGQYHVLVIIADGQVTRSIDTSDNELSPQEQKTIGSIADASFYPLSIVLVGVGDGPWEDMRKFDDKLPSREFDNFQFVNFTEIMSKHTTSSEKETAFALAALMEIPIQYKAAVEFGILGRTTGKKKKIVPRPPPVPYTHRAPTHEPSGLPAHTHRAPTREPSGLPAPAGDERSEMLCPICLTNGKDIAFGCGHMSCRDCAPRLSDCPICRQPIRSRLRVFTG
ncbi:E3 ubiquitin-protein ligase RGLG4-like isoform X2 [Pyrus x bretschneideri]|uniref:E3 ubiquitin-protein ligase RGLG4-like isoform X2 n=1 Tax=Pyrus x bretschneideri TaxID=225117 RepID=UPI00202EE596|nr:E3 ubiquitin-protein ligase RGLG4-like isoform X2 [Pyrus x bretschneideri]